MILVRILVYPEKFVSHLCNLNRTIYRKWQPTPVFMPGKFHGLRSLVGYSPWGRKESDTTERLHFTCLQETKLLIYLFKHFLKIKNEPSIGYQREGLSVKIVQMKEYLSKLT